MEKIKDGNDPDGDNSQLIDLMEKFLVKLKGVIDSSNGTEEPKSEAAPAAVLGDLLGFAGLLLDDIVARLRLYFRLFFLLLLWHRCHIPEDEQDCI